MRDLIDLSGNEQRPLLADDNDDDRTRHSYETPVAELVFRVMPMPETPRRNPEPFVELFEVLPHLPPRLPRAEPPRKRPALKHVLATLLGGLAIAAIYHLC